MILQINQYIFYDICNKNIDSYNDFINDVKKDYNNIIHELKKARECKDIRFQIHKLVGILSIISNKNNELNYICNNCLNVPKDCSDISSYTYFIDLLFGFDKTKIGL
jgi:Mg2+ and Co2+ transporter CorA